MLKNWNSLNYVRLPSVKITSPEQFVPLFVAFTSPTIYGGYITVNGKEISTPETDNWNYRNPPSTELMKNWLLEQLDFSYPAEYSLPIHKEHFIPCTNDIFESEPSVVKKFSGEYLPDDRITNYGAYIVLPGCFIKKNIFSVQSTTNLLFHNHFTCLSTASLLNNMRCLALIVVKAKRIPELRASILLKQPLSIPLNEFKFLRNSQGIDAIPLGLINYIKEKEPVVEYVTDAEVFKYLSSNLLVERITAKEAVAKAIEIAEDPSIIKPHCVYA